MASESKLSTGLVRAARIEDVKRSGCLGVRVGNRAVALFACGGEIYAVDNRCPHMGFPLDRGTVKDGILTCHWHHARFDLASGGTFDQWADNVRSFLVEIRDGEVWLDLESRVDPRAHNTQRMRDGLQRNIALVIGKAVINLLTDGSEIIEPFRIGLDFGARYRAAGWSAGLTTHTCMVNLLPHLDGGDRPRALYHGLSSVAQDCSGEPPRFQLEPLPSLTTGLDTLERWFRQFVEVRDAEGAERCLVSAVRAGASQKQLAEILFAAVTDHRYIMGGHAADFTNKALEALDLAGWDSAELVLSSLIAGYANADRMEESNAWRNPEDLVSLLEHAFEALPAALEVGRGRLESSGTTWTRSSGLVPVLLGDNASAIVDALVAAVHEGARKDELAGVVAYAAALRIAHFHTSNEFGDWDSALHAFTFANAVHQGLRRVDSPELLRGVFDAAMAVYLDRFLNVPPARLPKPAEIVENPDDLLSEFPTLLDRQQQVNEAGALVARYLQGPGSPKRLVAALGSLLLREDRDFHTIQMVEAAVRQYGLRAGTPAGAHVLVAAARYLAAHAPTVRAQGQTYEIARRLHRGECLFEE